MRFVRILSMFSLAALALPAQPAKNLMDSVLLKDWVPDSSLIVPITNIAKARFPAIDVHIHVGMSGTSFTGGDTAESIAGWVIMPRCESWCLCFSMTTFGSFSMVCSTMWAATFGHFAMCRSGANNRRTAVGSRDYRSGGPAPITIRLRTKVGTVTIVWSNSICTIRKSGATCFRRSKCGSASLESRGYGWM